MLPVSLIGLGSCRLSVYIFLTTIEQDLATVEYLPDLSVSKTHAINTIFEWRVSTSSCNVAIPPRYSPLQSSLV